MNKKKQIEKMASILGNGCTTPCSKCPYSYDCGELEGATKLYEQGCRIQNEVIDEFVKRLLDAFPEGNRDARCPAIYYDDYRYIIEELAEKMKGGK